MNDSIAPLLSQAYLDESAKLAFILGTGLNAAIELPLATIAPEKLGHRPVDWYEKTQTILVNTELSFFGGGTIPMTPWDEQLDQAHMKPGFQPLEYLIGGRYLGEIVRLIIADAVETAGLLDGKLPDHLSRPYSLETKTAGVIEQCVLRTYHIRY